MHGAVVGSSLSSNLNPSQSFTMIHICLKHTFLIILHSTDAPTSPKGRIIHKELYASFAYESSKLLAKQDPSIENRKKLVRAATTNFIPPIATSSSKLESSKLSNKLKYFLKFTDEY